MHNEIFWFHESMRVKINQHPTVFFFSFVNYIESIHWSFFFCFNQPIDPFLQSGYIYVERLLSICLVDRIHSSALLIKEKVFFLEAHYVLFTKCLLGEAGWF